MSSRVVSATETPLKVLNNEKTKKWYGNGGGGGIRSGRIV